ncbi:MAG TPA: MOSC domain-containing protein [Bryobacteraceae bacterium]
MQGTIIQINISPGGLPKRPIPQGRIGPEGLEGDAHAHPEFHGGLRKAVLLIAAEVVDDLAARGYPVFYGALGENLTMRGLDVRGLRVGDRLRAGSATLEITQLRVPCSQLDVYGDSLKGDLYDARVKAGDNGSPRWGMSGFYSSVVEPGSVAPGDIIAPVAELA